MLYLIYILIPALALVLGMVLHNKRQAERNAEIRARRAAALAASETDQPPLSEATKTKGGEPVPLEKQIQFFHDLGLHLAPESSLDHLLTSFPRSAYEKDPYALLFFMLGSEIEEEPWGRRFCDRVWNLDMECIGGDGDYATIARNLVGLAGLDDALENLQDRVDLSAPTSELSFALNGKAYRYSPENNGDWADAETLIQMISDIETHLPNRTRFWAADNGQAAIYCVLTQDAADQINAARPNLLFG